jgi:hypothetical protein
LVLFCFWYVLLLLLPQTQLETTLTRCIALQLLGYIIAAIVCGGLWFQGCTK